MGCCDAEVSESESRFSIDFQSGLERIQGTSRFDFLFEFKEVTNLDDVLPELDILYMTRVQKERFFNEEDYVRLKNSYILTKEKMALAKPDMAVLHPLPRVNEIAYDVDDNPKAYYFQQAQNGLYAREAILCDVLGITLDEVKA